MGTLLHTRVCGLPRAGLQELERGVWAIRGSVEVKDLKYPRVFSNGFWFPLALGSLVGLLSSLEAFVHKSRPLISILPKSLSLLRQGVFKVSIRTF